MLRVTLVQNCRRLFQGSASQVVLPGEGGEVTVLTFHAPMLCALEAGEVQIDEARFPVRQGLARVDCNIVTIVAQ